MSDIIEPKTVRHLEMTDAGTIASLRDEIVQLKFDHIAAHRINCYTIRFLEARIERLRVALDRAAEALEFYDNKTEAQRARAALAGKEEK